ncbi:hypothetical protein [Streptomyces sp. NPDC052015]|uniref:hypothetical protein n=1 Tax=Streptomyces sp. NPDC052015 TaxID=3154755 RepID=UPI00341CA784
MRFFVDDGAMRGDEGALGGDAGALSGDAGHPHSGRDDGFHAGRAWYDTRSEDIKRPPQV